MSEPINKRTPSTKTYTVRDQNNFGYELEWLVEHYSKKHPAGRFDASSVIRSAVSKLYEVTFYEADKAERRARSKK